MANELDNVPNRRRGAVSLTVSDGKNGRLVVTAYDGMLPEELLQEMMYQSIVLRMHGIENDQKERIWVGPTEAMQTALLSGLAATPVE